MEVAYHIFVYLKTHMNGGRIAFDLKMVEIDMTCFGTDKDWSDFYGKVKEEMPPKMPELRGNKVKISAFVDADHAGNKVTQRSHSGMIIFCTECPNHVVFEETVYGGRCNIW